MIKASAILERMFKMGIEYDKNNDVQGFLTYSNKFLDRFEAYKYAIDCGQLTPTEDKIITLYSEDI